MTPLEAMTPLDALLELLERIGALQGAEVLVSKDELNGWPAEAFRAMQSQKLLMKASPASSAVCPGCEQECTMPVHSPPTQAKRATGFVICDKRDDVNRVTVPMERLRQWRSSGEAVCAFVAKSIGIRPTAQRRAIGGLWEIGIATGSKRKQMLCLRAGEQLELVAGSHSVPLTELVRYELESYVVDTSGALKLVDASTTADSRYTPGNARREVGKLKTEALHSNWKREYRALKKRRPELSDAACALQIAKMPAAEGRSAETIRKHMKA